MIKVKTEDRLPTKNGEYFVYHKENGRDKHYFSNSTDKKLREIQTSYWRHHIEYWIDEAEQPELNRPEPIMDVHDY